MSDNFVAECYWTGVSDSALQQVDASLLRCSMELACAGDDVRYLGSILMRTDEVVLFLFEGTPSAIRRAAEAAGVPFERIVEARLVHPAPPDGCEIGVFTSMADDGRASSFVKDLHGGDGR